MSKPLARGCGFREASGIYACCNLGPGGRPIEEFLIDPPFRLPKALNITKSGINIRPVEQTCPKANKNCEVCERHKDDTGKPHHVVYHVFDWVGSEHYFYFTDFVEEARRRGTSRKWGDKTDFSLITDESRQVFIHEKAWIKEHELLYLAMTNPADNYRCPQHKRDHQTFEENHKGDKLIVSPEMCVGLAYHNIADGDVLNERYNSVGFPLVRRGFPVKEPNFSYEGGHPPFAATYEPAAFLRLPITRFEVIRDAKTNKHEESFGKAAKSNLPVVFADF